MTLLGKIEDTEFIMRAKNSDLSYFEIFRSLLQSGSLFILAFLAPVSLFLTLTVLVTVSSLLSSFFLAGLHIEAMFDKPISWLKTATGYLVKVFPLIVILCSFFVYFVFRGDLNFWFILLISVSEVSFFSLNSFHQRVILGGKQISKYYTIVLQVSVLRFLAFLLLAYNFRIGIIIFVVNAIIILSRFKAFRKEIVSYPLEGVPLKFLLKDSAPIGMSSLLLSFFDSAPIIASPYILKLNVLPSFMFSWKIIIALTIFSHSVSTSQLRNESEHGIKPLGTHLRILIWGGTLAVPFVFFGLNFLDLSSKYPYSGTLILCLSFIPSLRSINLILGNRLMILNLVKSRIKFQLFALGVESISLALFLYLQLAINLYIYICFIYFIELLLIGFQRKSINP